MSKLHYVSWAEAEALKTLAMRALNEPLDPETPRSERDLVVTAEALLSLIDQSRSAMLGLATTKELKDEIAARGLGSPDDYRTFVPPETVGGDHGR